MRYKLSEILSAALAYYEISSEEWESIKSRRLGKSVIIKQTVSLIAFESGYTHKEIGQFLGKSRCDIIHHVNVFKEQCDIYQEYREAVDNIISSLNMNQPHQVSHYEYGWLARSATGLLTLSPVKPEKMAGFWIAEGTKPFSSQQSFPQITYASGPVQVKIRTTIEGNEKM